MPSGVVDVSLSVDVVSSGAVGGVVCDVEVTEGVRTSVVVHVAMLVVVVLLALDVVPVAYVVVAVIVPGASFVVVDGSNVVVTGSVVVAASSVVVASVTALVGRSPVGTVVSSVVVVSGVVVLSVVLIDGVVVVSGDPEWHTDWLALDSVVLAREHFVSCT